MLSLPFTAVGGIWLIHYLNYELSVTGTVGFIALAGDNAEIGVLVYIDISYKKCLKENRINKTHRTYG
jgi:Cu(I)/Ag(I) efflux system membrane protein CusA/SilA